MPSDYDRSANMHGSYVELNEKTGEYIIAREVGGSDLVLLLVLLLASSSSPFQFSLIRLIQYDNERNNKLV